MEPYYLTEAEIAACKAVGGLRNIAALGSGTVDRRMSKSMNSHETNEDGMIGEYAFCKSHNIFLNFNPEPRSGSCDCVLENIRIDVKTTRYANGKLVATVKGNPDVDVFALAIYDPHAKVVYFPGWISAKSLYSDEFLTDLGHGQTYAVPQDRLLPWNRRKHANNDQPPRLRVVSNSDRAAP